MDDERSACPWQLSQFFNAVVLRKITLKHERLLFCSGAFIAGAIISLDDTNEFR
jgi:hypothetical protein